MSQHDQIWMELIDKNNKILKTKNPKHFEGINEMIAELQQLSKVSTDDNFLKYLFGILENSQQILMPPTPPASKNTA